MFSITSPTGTDTYISTSLIRTPADSCSWQSRFEPLLYSIPSPEVLKYNLASRPLQNARENLFSVRVLLSFPPHLSLLIHNIARACGRRINRSSPAQVSEQGYSLLVPQRLPFLELPEQRHALRRVREVRGPEVCPEAHQRPVVSQAPPIPSPSLPRPFTSRFGMCVEVTRGGEQTWRGRGCRL